MPLITVKHGNLDEHLPPWNRHKLAYNMGLWDFSYAYAVLTLPINQYIRGIKEFETFPILPSGFPINDTDCASKFYVDYTINNNVTFENLDVNGDVGGEGNQLAVGNHSHANLPSEDQKSALDTSDNPNAINPFVTWGQFSSHANRHSTVGQDKIVTLNTRKVETFIISVQNIISNLVFEPIINALMVFVINKGYPTNPTTDWSISGATITWNQIGAGYNLEVGDIVVVDYNYLL